MAADPWSGKPFFYKTKKHAKYLKKRSIKCVKFVFELKDSRILSGGLLKKSDYDKKEGKK